MSVEEYMGQLSALRGVISRRRSEDERLSAYYEGAQRLQHIGLAVPPELRQFETVINVPRMAVDEPERRLDVKALIMPGSEKDDPVLRQIWDTNNLDAVIPLFCKDALIYGRSFLSIAGSAEHPEVPSIMVEHAPSVAVDWNPLTRRADAGLVLHVDEKEKQVGATLYRPDVTVYFVKGRSWEISDVVPHGLGVVPLIRVTNRARAGAAWENGTSEMADVIGLTDQITRTLSVMQVGLESTALPHKWAAGMTPKDFVDKNGKPIPQWESYMTSIWATANTDAKFGIFPAGALDNFYDAVNNMLAWCAATLGLPTRYAGQQSVNPAAEGAIKADEARLVKNVERKQVTFGDGIGRALAIAYLAGGHGAVDGNRVSVTWHDAATPTFSQRADALQKLAGGLPILSREGAWDELGFSEPRKAREREYFAAQEADPTLSAIFKEVS